MHSVRASWWSRKPKTALSDTQSINVTGWSDHYSIQCNIYTLHKHVYTVYIRRYRVCIVCVPVVDM